MGIWDKILKIEGKMRWILYNSRVKETKSVEAKVNGIESVEFQSKWTKSVALKGKWNKIYI